MTRKNFSGADRKKAAAAKILLSFCGKRRIVSWLCVIGYEPLSRRLPGLAHAATTEFSSSESDLHLPPCGALPVVTPAAPSLLQRRSFL
ncbi:MAG: hypothetical protein LDL30_05575 [Desulfovibrio sp.]|nr:hypothetical protein [Desulfovibrio sp.]MCA1985937.1 hypothetical protein [Desulfovibrio sp.]